MAAWGIEELGDGEYKVIKLPYRWQLKKWVAEKPDKRHTVKHTNELDKHLVVKAHRSSKTRFYDTRRVKV